MLALLLGVILFLRWAWMQKAADVLNWAKWLIVAGLIGTLLTSAFGLRGYGWNHKSMWKDGKMIPWQDGNMNMMHEIMEDVR